VKLYGTDRNAFVNHVELFGKHDTFCPIRTTYYSPEGSDITAHISPIPDVVLFEADGAPSIFLDQLINKKSFDLVHVIGKSRFNYNVICKKIE